MEGVLDGLDSLDSLDTPFYWTAHGLVGSGREPRPLHNAGPPTASWAVAAV